MTGAESGFEYQLKALEYLRDSGLSFNIAVVSTRRDKEMFFRKLREMNPGKIMVEEEQIKLYPAVRKRLDKEGLLHFFEE